MNTENRAQGLKLESPDERARGLVDRPRFESNSAFPAVRLRYTVKTLNLRLLICRLTHEGAGHLAQPKVTQEVLVNIGVILLFLVVIRGKDTLVTLWPFCHRLHSGQAESASSSSWP